ncbi:MAG: hypothetical protein ACTSXD_07050 [Candidatus Heimdallarchaeaceae archaeon]
MVNKSEWFENYSKFLESNRRKEMKENILGERDFTCWEGIPFGLEPKEDLRLLCVDCHNKIHSDVFNNPNITIIGKIIKCPECRMKMQRIGNQKFICPDKRCNCEIIPSPNLMEESKINQCFSYNENF